MWIQDRWPCIPAQRERGELHSTPRISPPSDMSEGVYRDREAESTPMQRVPLGASRSKAIGTWHTEKTGGKIVTTRCATAGGHEKLPNWKSRLGHLLWDSFGRVGRRNDMSGVDGGRFRTTLVAFKLRFARFSASHFLSVCDDASGSHTIQWHQRSHPISGM